jgi:hypothetical protein
MHRITEKQSRRQGTPVLGFLNLLCFLCLLSPHSAPPHGFSRHESRLF